MNSQLFFWHWCISPGDTYSTAAGCTSWSWKACCSLHVCFGHHFAVQFKSSKLKKTYTRTGKSSPRPYCVSVFFPAALLPCSIPLSLARDQYSCEYWIERVSLPPLSICLFSLIFSVNYNNFFFFFFCPLPFHNRSLYGRLINEQKTIELSRLFRWRVHAAMWHRVFFFPIFFSLIGFAYRHALRSVWLYSVKQHIQCHRKHAHIYTYIIHTTNPPHFRFLTHPFAAFIHFLLSRPSCLQCFFVILFLLLEILSLIFFYYSSHTHPYTVNQIFEPVRCSSWWHGFFYLYFIFFTQIAWFHITTRIGSLKKVDPCSTLKGKTKTNR